MAEFFKGGRRKTGVVTLLMALAFGGGWLRSFVGFDFIGVYSGTHTSHTVLSVGGMIGIQNNNMRDVDLSGFGPRPLLGDWGSGGDMLLVDLPPSPSTFYWGTRNREDLLANPDITWRVWGSVLNIGENSDKNMSVDRLDLWIVPYWSIVIPLTALSAFLLLSSPRRSTREKEVELIPETVA